MGKARNKNRSLTKSDKVYAKKSRNKIKKQNIRRTGMTHVLKKLAAVNKDRLAGLQPNESRRSFRKRLAKFKVAKLKERKNPKTGDTDAELGKHVIDANNVTNPKTVLGPKNASFDSLKSEWAALQRRIEANVPTPLKKFNNMLKLCAAIGEYHLAVFVLGQMSAQDLELDDETYNFLALLQEKTPTNETYIQGVDISDALGGLHPKGVIKQLLQKRKVEGKWAGLQSAEVPQVKKWLQQNISLCNERAKNRFKLASLIASNCKVSNRKARNIITGLAKSGFVKQTKAKSVCEWVIRGTVSSS
jgi:hypothetical protein